ncbi:MAG: DUF2782 domain-containing protein [Casimicrobiaceae bacterium]
MTPARLALSTAVALFAATLAFAQSRPPAPSPPPIPPAGPSYAPSVTPAPPPDVATDPDLEPQITILRREDNTVEEVRVRGELQYVKVTPSHGKPYFLIPDAAGHAFIRRDSLDIRTRPAMWLLFSW